MTNQKIKTISIADDFSKYPAGRFREDGEANGARFRDDYLAPALQNVEVDKVIVVFDGVAGFGSSFLEEAFGGLVRQLGMQKAFLDERLELTSTESDLEDFVLLARRYIEDAVAADRR